AAPGLPWESARGAQSEGGLSIGISPALSLHEHVNFYKSPADHFDVMIYTGSGLMGREIVNIRSSDMVAIINGRSGTLGEFSIAYDEAKLIGVVKGSGGIADIIPQLVHAIEKDTGAVILYDSDPAALVDRMIGEYVGRHFKHPSILVQNGYEKKGGTRSREAGEG
ncbi:MAG TPA: protein containing YHS domain protein, partial [Thermoleophilia bacterium]|nr:protein containing YHS domain protein [Thermoleophilia bacterium]